MHRTPRAASPGEREPLQPRPPSRAQEALAARDQTHGYKLDRSHTFAVTLFDDFERYAKVAEQYQEPPPQPYKPTVRPLCFPALHLELR